MRFANRGRLVRNGVVALLGLVLFSTIASPASEALPPGGPGSAGTNTAIPDTESAVTARGRGDFSDLEIKVNQTRNLVNQAVSVTWAGGVPTQPGNGSRFDEHYLQIMQCWGEDDGSVPENPGPPPEQCVFGASGGVFGGIATDSLPAGFAGTRVVTRSTWPNFDPGDGFLETQTTNVWRPFRAVDGTVVNSHTDPSFNPSVQGGQFWQNPYFNILTTNEIAATATGADGAGAELFRIDNGIESNGLGCGQRLVPAEGGAPRVPKCWMVVVPRGDAVTENVGTPNEGVVTAPVTPSALSTSAWRNRIAIPLEFNPVDTACELGADERRLVGTELVAPAITSWQPALCATPGLPPYSFANVSDAGARQQVVTPSAGAPGMVITPRPIDPTFVTPDNPVVYAPVSLSGIVIGFNIERVPGLEAPPEQRALNAVRVERLNLTPRLIAKLLTQSYAGQVRINNSDPGYPWVTANPSDMRDDPEFRRFNPEFDLLQMPQVRSFGGLLMPGGTSDLARQVWEYVLADPEAKAWLDGRPDPWGMRVNPIYATTAEANANDFPFADPAPDSFPKADPYCFVPAPRPIPGGDTLQGPALCGTDWLPYTQSLREGARLTRLADDRARINEDPFAIRPESFWRRDAPQTIGTRAMLTLTDTASAAQFGLQAARLSRAGDNGDDRRFIAPDAGGLTAGVSGMSAVTVPSVLEPDPVADAPAGYPLTSLSYAIIRPLSLDAEARAEYAAFVDYASGPGQVEGFEPGQLPIGYAALPPALRAQARAAATEIRELQPPPPPQPEAPSEPPPASAGGFVAPPPAASAAVPPTRSSPTTTAPQVEPAGAAVETASGPEESTESGLLTPIVALARNRFVLPILAGVAVLSAWLALEIARRPRRAAARAAADAP